MVDSGWCASTIYYPPSTIYVFSATAVARRADDNVAYHVSKAAFGKLVERALAELPEPFATHLEEVPVEIRQRPTTRQLATYVASNIAYTAATVATQEIRGPVTRTSRHCEDVYVAR